MCANMWLYHVSQEWPGGPQAATVDQVACWWRIRQGPVRQECGHGCKCSIWLSSLSAAWTEGMALAEGCHAVLDPCRSSSSPTSCCLTAARSAWSTLNHADSALACLRPSGCAVHTAYQTRWQQQRQSLGLEWAACWLANSSAELAARCCSSSNLLAACTDCALQQLCKPTEPVRMHSGHSCRPKACLVSQTAVAGGVPG